MKYLQNDQFPLSSKYDPLWIFENEMGPNVLWLTEFLCEKLNLKPGMRVLDMGCGKALSSIFMVKEYGVKVVANDLWIDPADNWNRIKEAGLEDSIIPIHAEANSLPYAKGYFDIAVSIDSYIYFGQKPKYTEYFLDFISPHGQFGICHIALNKKYSEIDFKNIPDYLIKWYRGNVDYEFSKAMTIEKEQIFTMEEWVENINKSKKIKILTADLMGNGCQNHVMFLEDHKKAGFTYRAPNELDEWKKDGGYNFDFLRIVGQVL